MRRSRLLPSVSVVVVTIGIWTATIRGQPPARSAAAHVAGELLVKFHDAASAGRRGDVLSGLGARVLRHFRALDVDHLRLPEALTVDAAVARLRADPDVLSVQPNYIREATAVAPPNDPYWTSDALWGMRKISVNAAWTNFTKGDGTVVIANIDTGVNYNHPDLAANMWRNPGEIPGNGIDDDGNGYIDDVYGIDVANGDSDPLDDNGHGTHTAGTAAALGNNGVGVVGVNWNAKILACKFLNASGSGTDSGAIACFDYIVALKNRGINIRVSSNSWGEQRSAGQPFPTVMKSAIDAAGSAGILNVFAAGNTSSDNDSAPFDPASIGAASGVAVAASDDADNRASFSNYGSSSVDIAAPGVSILSTYGGSYAYLSGTSMAAPHVAGAAALLAAQRPSASVAALKSYLLANVDRLGQWSGVIASGGRLNVFASMLAAAGNAPPTVAVTSPQSGTVYTAPASIPLIAAASDSDGTVAQVTFFADGVALGTDATAPYALTWSNVPAGSYAITAIATDNIGAATVSAPVSVTVTAGAGLGTSTPFGGTPWAIPGTIEAENFDDGGDGIAYHDLTSGNAGGAYRSTDVDIEPTTDAGGGFNVGWITAGEWLNYTVSVAQSGSYLLTARVAAKAAGGTFHVEFGGVDKTGPLTIPNTGGKQSWADLTTTVSLTAGTQSMRLVADANGTVFGNLNALRFAPASGGAPTPFGGTPWAIPGTIQAEDFDEGGESIAYHDTSAGNKGGTYRATDVDIEATSDGGGGGYDVGWITAGEWLNYTVSVAQSGTYTVTVRVAAKGAGGAFHIEFGGADKTGRLVISDTGGWQIWTDVTTTVVLAAGRQSMRIVADTNGPGGVFGNINYVRIQ